MKSNFGNPAFIIAEIGVNHENSLARAFEMIIQCANANVDAVKFQAYRAEKLAAKFSPSYWNLDEEPIGSQIELFSNFDKFTFDEYSKLAKLTKELGMNFILTCFDLNIADELNVLVDFHKIASADITNLPLIRKIASFQKPIILSTGAASLQEIYIAYDEIRKINKKEISLLHCVLNYPTLSSNAMLDRILVLKQHFPETQVGYSDHTKPDSSNLILNSAFVLGAEIFEKHFTFDVNKKGNDHYHSMDFTQIQKWIEDLKLISSARHYSESKFIDLQSKARTNARRGIYASKDISLGDLLTDENITTLRPVATLSASRWDDVIGTASKHNFKAGDEIVY
jgi:N-acetylneuraminate synthase